MEEMISVREFARREDFSEAYVRQAVQRNDLRKIKGKLPALLVGTGWCPRIRQRLEDSANSVRSEGANTAHPSAHSAQLEVGAIAEPLDLDKADEFIARVLRGDYASQFEADRIKANALALKHVLMAREKAGDLMSVTEAERAFFDAGRMSRDAWLNFPTRVGPRIAAELNVDADKLVETLTVHVHQQLTDIGEPEVSFGGDGTPVAVLSKGADAAAED